MKKRTGWILGFLIGTGMLTVPQVAYSQTPAILVESAEVVMDGKSLAKVNAGQAVSIIGERPQSLETLIMFKDANNEQITGLVPSKALVITNPAETPAPTPTPAPQPTATPEPEFSQVQKSADLAKRIKGDRTLVTALLGRNIKVSGKIDKVDIASMSSGGGSKIVCIYLGSGADLPRIKVQLSPSISNNDAFFEAFRKYLPSWWWTRTNRNIDFRMASRDQIQGRAVWQTSSQTTHSSGYTSSSTSKNNSDWFPIFTVGDQITLEGTFSGYRLDIELASGLVDSK